MSVTFTNQAKNTATLTTEAKSTIFSGYTKLENGSYILQESGGKLILDQSVAAGNVWTTQAKS